MFWDNLGLSGWMDIQEAGNTGYLCEGNWVVRGQKVRRANTLHWGPFSTFWILLHVKVLIFQKTHTSGYGSCWQFLSSVLSIKSITDHKIQANIGKEMRRFSTLRTLLPSDGKVAVTEIHTACVWNVHWRLVLFSLKLLPSWQGKADKNGKEAEHF